MIPDCNSINRNAQFIVENIANESVDVYLFLMGEYAKGKIITNHVFQFVFRSFYRLDGAGLTDEFKTEYFRLLEGQRGKANVDFRQLVKQLYDIPNHRGKKTIQFSFVTKLANTTNENFPIYDSNVAHMYGFRRPFHNDSFESRLTELMTQYSELQKSYLEIIGGDLLNKTFAKFKEKFESQAQRMPKIKILDFIMWSCGKLKDNQQLRT